MIFDTKLCFLLVSQTTTRQAFGKPLASQGTIQAAVAQSRVDIEQTRLLVLKAAHMMDLYGNKVSQKEKTVMYNLHISQVNKYMLKQMGLSW